MPLYRRLPKRGFKKFNQKRIAIINLSELQNFIKTKRIKSSDELNIKYLKEKKVIRKDSNLMKILGKGEIKEKLKFLVNFKDKK